MPLINMAKTPEPKKPQTMLGETPEMEHDEPKYPYGLEICLETDALEKLSMELPEVGAAMMLNARVVVTSVSSRQELDGETCQSVRLQITDMMLEDAPNGERTTAQKLYG